MAVVSSNAEEVSSSCAKSGPRKAIFLRDELGRSASLGDLAPSRKGSLARSAAEVGRGGLGQGMWKRFAT